MTNSQDQFVDFYRAGLKATGDMIRASLESAERLRTQQLAAINEALASHANAVAEVDDAMGFEELVAVQSKLASAQYQTVIGYWNGIYQVASESQAEVTKRVQAQAEQMRENLQRTLGSAQSGSVPIMASLQPLIEVASSVYAATARATEEATKRVAAQLEATNASVNEAAKQVQRRSA